MRIAYVAHVASPDVVGDPFCCLELAKQMSARGHNPSIITWNKRNPSINRMERIDDVDVWRLAGVNFKLGYSVTEYPFILGMMPVLRRLKPDIIHAHSHLFATSVQAITKAKRLGLPTVLTVHGVFADRSLSINLAQRAYLSTFGSMVLKKADRIVCLTRNDAREITRIGCAREKIRVIPNAVDTVRFRPGKRREDNLIVWVGRFVPEKGVEYLIKAARIVPRKSSTLRFLLIGNGPLKAKISKMANDQGLPGKSVTIAGPMSRDGIAEILAKAAIFVFPSLKEGLPVSVLEAMASGVPVVSSDIAGVNEVIIDGQNGLLVPPKKPEALANAIHTLLDDENLGRRLSKNARQLMIEKYNWNTTIGDTEKVYDEAIAAADQ